MGKVVFKGDIKTNYKQFVRKSIEPDLEARADRVVAAAKATKAFNDRTGELRKSIRKVPLGRRSGFGYRIIADAKAPGADSSYALAVEMGHMTRTASKAGIDPAKLKRRGTPSNLFVAPRPFMLPALEAAKDET